MKKLLFLLFLSRKTIIGKVMLKSSLMLFLLFGTISQVSALDQRLSIGILGGPSLGGSTGKDATIWRDHVGSLDGFHSKGFIGGQVGLAMQYSLPEYFIGLQTEVMFLLNRGLEYTHPMIAGTHGKIVGDQVSFNLLLQGVIPTTDILTLTVFAGPTFSVPLGKIKQTLHINDVELSNFQLAAHPVTYGIVTGVGLQVDCGPGFFTVDGRFQMDFTPFSPERDLYFTSPFTLQVGYAFYLVK